MISPIAQIIGVFDIATRHKVSASKVLVILTPVKFEAEIEIIPKNTNSATTQLLPTAKKN